LEVLLLSVVILWLLRVMLRGWSSVLHIHTCSWSEWQFPAPRSSAWRSAKYTSGLKHDFRTTGRETTKAGRLVWYLVCVMMAFLGHF